MRRIFVCRWCGLDSDVPDDERPPLCGDEEAHEWGTWTPADEPVPSSVRCTRCDGNGQTWDPGAPQNIGSCHHCDGRGTVPSGGCTQRETQP